MLGGAPVCGVDVVQVLAEFPALAFGVGDDGLAQAPGLVTGLIQDRASRRGRASAGLSDVIDEHAG